jgi:hypothetical protein
VHGTEGRACIPFYGTPSAWDKKQKPIDPAALALPAGASPFTCAYDQIAEHLAGGALPDCTDAAFVAVHEACFAGMESVLTNRRIAIPNANRQRKVFANG